MKKFFIILVAFCCAFSLTAIAGLDISMDFGAGYMNYTMITVYNRDVLKDQLSNELAAGLGDGALKLDDPKAKDSYNALTLGLGLKVSYFYANISCGFPFKNDPVSTDPLSKKLVNMGVSSDIKGSIIIDGQLGGGITLLKNTPLNIFLGGGIAVNYIRTKRVLPKAFVESITSSADSSKPFTEYRAASLGGLGINAAVRYFFTDHIGLTLDLKETVYFLPILNQRYYRGITTGGDAFTYYINKEGSKDQKKMIKKSWANDFELRAGIVFKF